MKFVLKMLTVVVIILVFSLPIAAKEADEYIEEFENILPSDISSRLDGNDAASLVGFDALLSELSCIFNERRGEIISFLLVLFGGVILLTAASMIEGPLSSVTEAGVGAIVGLIIFSRIGGIFAEISESVLTLSSFFSAFIPIATALTAAAGGTSTALVQNSGMNITLWLLSGVGNSFFTSVVGFGLAISLTTAFGDDGSLSITRSVKNFFVFCVGTVSAVLGATLSLQTVVASATDSASMRAARYAATGFIPVVGAAVSGALSTLVSGLTYAKGIIGAGGIAVIVICALSPLVMLLLYRFCILCASSFAELCGRGSAARIISAFKFSLDSMIALYTVSVIIYIIEIVMFMKGGVVSA